jgi:hypothetical protein
VFLSCSYADRRSRPSAPAPDRSRDIIQLSCPGCGWIVEYGYGTLQRLHHLPSTMLVFDLQFRDRCKQCRCIDGFRITVFDDRSHGDRSADRRERVIVAGGAPRYQRPIAISPKRVE